ncbi:MAG: DEAD/DEAH box helicase [Treponema sp.]|nr:DEAD/DEAH box helicase [Treponema sp.]
MAETEGFEVGSRVRLRANPGRIGNYTGRSRMVAGFKLLEIDFGPNDIQNIRESQLEKVPKHETMEDLFDSGRFGGPNDLAKIIITAKLRGDLTNVFYSMGISNTEFFPHQFKPVLKFIESPRGRLLIADEVGLGKTIESIYVWKELQAREGARRLLIVCPSMLREKWKRDLEIRFSEEAEVVDAKALLEKLENAAKNPSRRSFILITSIEGIRARSSDWDPDAFNNRAKLCGFLEEMAERTMEPLLDLVIIDEAHYLRNSNTASFQTASILRENSAHLLLLSATPIQTDNENLFNLLKLLSPEEFSNYETFNNLSTINSILIELANTIRYRATKESLDKIKEIIKENKFIIGEDLASNIQSAINKGELGPEERIDLSHRIGERSFFSQYINRTRKRDVIENRVIRVPQTVTFTFTEYEKYLYDTVTQFLRDKSERRTTLSEFVLIARQRQMTSSLPAAFKHWKDNDSMDDQLWDDLGVDLQDEEDVKIIKELYNLPIAVELDKLERYDSKYEELKKQLKPLLIKSPKEKIIIFSFYRGTISYLAKRLDLDGFRLVTILGGMGDEKYEIIESFAKDNGPNILISSEVGAEGIDLQFSHIIINYDLPWNPMKLEQRIGRIDRIGQASDKIFIYNISCSDTIEDRVLTKLYERINIFKSSIGDLEDIMGTIVDRLALDLIDPKLSDEDREQRAEQNMLMLENNRKLRNELEDKAIDLFGFRDYIIRAIDDAKQLERFVDPSDTIKLVDTFFNSYYPGTKIQLYKEKSTFLIKLSPEAKVNFASYCETVRPQINTKLHRSESEILCIFDPKTKIDKTNLYIERIDAIHPLIRWIVEENDKHLEDRHPCSAIMLEHSNLQLKPGIYTYFIQLWQAKGWKSKKEIHFYSAPIGGYPLSSNDSEKLIVSGFRYGQKWYNWNEFVNILAARQTLDSLMDNAFQEYSSFETDFINENENICNKQGEYAKRTAERKIAEVEDLIQRLEVEGKQKVIPIHRARITKIKEQLEIQNARIKKYMVTESVPINLAMGILKLGV